MPAPFPNARWIWSAERGDRSFAVRRFRGRLRVERDQTVTLNISADSRYILYVDGKLIGRGPARSDLRHYVYETYALDLTAGEHVLAVLVLTYMAEAAPMAEMHYEGGLLAEALGADGGSLLATAEGADWRVQADRAYTPNVYPPVIPHFWCYYVSGATEILDGALVPHGWERPGFDDSAWERPAIGHRPYVTGAQMNAEMYRQLMPRDIPHLREETREMEERGQFPLTVPANTKRETILRPGDYVLGYPVLEVRGGKASSVELRYAEALGREGKKRVRDEGDDLAGLSIQDVYRPGGGEESYSPLHWRAFRFLKLTVQTGPEPLEIRSVTYRQTGYPFERASSFSADSVGGELQAIQEIDFHSLECCAVETFMDCPFYEQLSYVGDARVEALVSYVTTGDTRLGERAVKLFNWSRTADGLTLSRYPTSLDQWAPTFSLIWVLMVEDLWRYARGAEATVREALPGCRTVLEWLDRHADAADIVSGPMLAHSFVDHTKGFRAITEGQPDACINLQRLAAIQAYSRLADALGDAREATYWRARADILAESIRRTFWDAAEGLFREGPTADWGYTQHAQAWGLLTGATPADAVQKAVERLHTDDRLDKATYYHTFYIVEALAKVGRLEHLWDRWLRPWRDMLALHFRTWPENPEPTRSDCHAWTAWPSYALLTHVLGVRPSAPGFASFAVEPRRVAGWDRVTGTVPTPNGPARIEVRWSDGSPAPKIDQG